MLSCSAAGVGLNDGWGAGVGRPELGLKVLSLKFVGLEGRCPCKFLVSRESTRIWFATSIDIPQKSGTR